MIAVGHSPGGCGGVFADGVVVPAGGDGRIVDRAGRAGAVRRILHGFGVGGLIDRELPAPGSAAGYSPSLHVLPLVLMLAGGGRTLEDLRVLRRDEGLRALLPQLNEMPSSDATGDWLRRIGAKESGGLVGLQHVNGSVFRRLLLSDEGVDYTLDIDATQIVAEKHEAHYTYKGEKGYMPMVGHIAELGVVIGHEFREGNAAPAAGNLEFLQACERNMPKGKRIVAVRADSAAYQAAIFNWCEVTGKVCDTIREFMRRGVVVRTVINGMVFDGAAKDPMQQAVRDALIGFMAARAQGTKRLNGPE